jgi:outer membrane protein assembly factor BamE (lipoprotein component of BamABCDE complex)
MKNTATLLLALAALALSGCVIWPASEKRELTGTRVGAGQLEFIQPGVTTRSNVLSALGAPTDSFADISLIAATPMFAWAAWDARLGKGNDAKPE